MDSVKIYCKRQNKCRHLEMCEYFEERIEAKDCVSCCDVCCSKNTRCTIEDQCPWSIINEAEVIEAQNAFVI